MCAADRNCLAPPAVRCRRAAVSAGENADTTGRPIQQSGGFKSRIHATVAAVSNVYTEAATCP